MKSARIIPCLDISNGRVVKGVNFVDIKDAGDPVEIAKKYFEQGADELTLLDISATAENRPTLLKLITDISQSISIPLTIGGGIKSLEDIEEILQAGANKISIGSAAVNNPELVKEASNKFGKEAITVAIDAKQTSEDSWEIFIQGGKKATGIDALKWAKKMASYGAGELLVTSMDRDGTKSGFDLSLTRKIAEETQIPVIASGGVGNLDHLVEGIIHGKANAVLAASIFHFGEYTIAEAKEALAAAQQVGG